MPSDETFRKTLRHFLAPVMPFLDDASVSEVMINGPDEVFIERAGKLIKTDVKFAGEPALLAAVVNVLQFAGKRVDPHNPLAEARLPDGSRVHVAGPPCSRHGTVVTIRKHSRTMPTVNELVRWGTLSAAAAEYLGLMVAAEKNLLVSGGTSSGKTTLLNVISGFIPADQRIVVIEDTSELRLAQSHVIGMEARAPDRMGRGGVTIRDLFRGALRMRPDRVIVGECRGGEALDMIQAMTSGHAGSMSTLHSDTTHDALARLETLAMMSAVQLPPAAIRQQVASAIHLVVQVARLADGRRRVVEIAEVMPLSADGHYSVGKMFELRAGEGGALDLAWTGRVSRFAGDPKLAPFAAGVRRTAALLGRPEPAPAPLPKVP